MGEHHRQPQEITPLAEDLSVQVATHEDGHVVVVLGEGEGEEAFIVDPYLACALGDELFKAGQAGRALIEERQNRGGQ